MDVKTLCLGVLARGPATGYEIRKAFEEGPFSHFQEAGFGSIYPALRKLTEDGLVALEELEQDGRPDRKVYRILAKGRQALFDAVNAAPGEDRFRSDFCFILCFAELLGTRELDRLISDRIAMNRESLARMDAAEKCANMSPGLRFVVGLGRAHHKAELAYLEEHQHELIGSLLQRDVAE